ncbi:MAG TPA: hypothetical protein VF678_07005 [bacterium]
MFRMRAGRKVGDDARWTHRMEAHRAQVFEKTCDRGKIQIVGRLAALFNAKNAERSQFGCDK